MVHAEVLSGTTPVCNLQLCAAERLAEIASVAAAATELEAVDSLGQVAHNIGEVVGMAAADAPSTSLVGQEPIAVSASVSMLLEHQYAGASEHMLAGADLPGPEAEMGMDQMLVMTGADSPAAAEAIVDDIVEVMVVVDTGFAVSVAGNRTDSAALPSGCHMSRIAGGFAEMFVVVVESRLLPGHCSDSNSLLCLEHGACVLGAAGQASTDTYSADGRWMEMACHNLDMPDCADCRCC